MNSIVQVSVPCPLYQHFDYLSIDKKENWLPGLRVKVSFNNRDVIGITLNARGVNEKDNINKLKPIGERLDKTPLLTKESFNLINWISQYYHHPLGECFHVALPKRLRLGDDTTLKTETIWLSVNNEEQPVRLGKNQQQILALLADYPDGVQQSVLRQHLSNSITSLHGLEKKGLVQSKQEIELPPQIIIKQDHCQLNEQQQTAVDLVKQKTAQFQPFLLEGVTGSGKTEVYIHLTQHILTQNKQVLILIPEIGLTTQFVERFKKQLHANIVVLNSSVSDVKRKQAWLLAKEGIADVIIGTRSAIFVPLKAAGLIILDEEHDNAYKQQDGLHYHARNVALVSAQKLNIPIVLGSATPSLETLYHVEQKRYTQLILDKRAGDAKLPHIKLINSNGGSDVKEGLTKKLIDSITTHLANNNQVLLFVNRRGFAPVLMCHECNWQAKCNHCDSFMVVHQSRNGLICHHCGLVQTLPKQCPSCQNQDLYNYGVGTEKIEKKLKSIFSDIPVLRIDKDTTQRVKAFENMVTYIKQGGAKILVGTQMLAKGHDFHDVTMVGILDADQGLFSSDFRAIESLAQLITQVTGRAGRGQKVGEVFIQTQQPQHPFWSALIKQGYAETAKTLLAERGAMQLPPVGALCVIRAESRERQLAMQLLTDMLAIFNQADQKTVIIMGPVPSIMEKRAGRYRAQLLLSSNHRKHIHPLLDFYMDALCSLKLARKVRWSIDIDPIDLM